MIYIFCDTCVFLNLATDPKLFTITQKLTELTQQGIIILVVPSLVKKELEDNKDKIVEKKIASYKSHLKNLKNITDLFTPATQEILQNESAEIHRNLPNMEEVLTKNIGEISKLVDNSIQVNYNQDNINNVTERAINKSFPFHRNKNSIKDALISETFIDFCNAHPADLERLYFVTDNTEDFSSVENKNLPHPDWAHYFAEPVFYNTNIGNVINEIVPEAIAADTIHEIEENKQPSCTEGSHDFDYDKGFWRHSQYGGGLSWHHACRKCGMLWDTGDFFD